MQQHSLILLYILLLFSESLAQIRHDNRRKDILPVLSSKKLSNVKEINLNHASTANEWITFKNWNEGISVVAENDSIVWMGTSVGLIRWNTKNSTYQTFAESNGLLYTNIRALALDHKNQLWLATGQGLVKYANGIFNHYNHLNCPIPETGFTHIVIDSKDQLYLGVDEYIANDQWNIGFFIYDSVNWHIINLQIDGWVGPLWALQCYHDTIYISCGYTQIYKYTSNGLEKDTDWPSNCSATSFAIDYQDSLWALSNMFLSNGRQLLKLSKNKWQTVLGITVGESIWNDPQGGLWTSTYRLNLKTFTLSPVSGLTDFTSHFALSSNNQYFATRSGLLKFNGSTFQSFQIPYTLRSNTIYSLGTSPSGEVYYYGDVSQKTDGVTWNVVPNRSWFCRQVKFKPDGSFWYDGINEYDPTGVDFDGYDALWGAYGGIITLNANGFKQWTIKDIGMQRPSNYYSPDLMDIVIDKNENIWATGWYNGTVMHDRTNWHPFYSSDTTLINTDYDRIFVDSKNRVWFGTNWSSPNYGFTVFNGKQWRSYNSSQRYRISYVYQMAEDHFGNVWLATGGGLLKYDGMSFTVFDNTNTLMNSNTIYAVTVDLRNNIWVGTNSGLYVYNPSGVQLGPYSYSSPVDSFSITQNGRFAVARFFSTAFSGDSANYQLQRGRSTSKFWPVAETGFMQNCCTSIYLTDTSNIIGNYYYRIKRIASDGKTAYSSSLSFNGGQKQAHLVDWQSYFSSNQLFFKCKIQDYSFIVGIEILRSDISTNQSKIVARLSIDSPKSPEGYFIIGVDSLQISSPEFLYTLTAVFTDSSRILLATRKVTLHLPSTFTVSNNYPNPFNGSTSLDVYVPNPGKVVLQLYDILGREILPAIKRDYEVGYQTIQVNLNSLATGLYFCTVDFNNQKICKKLILLK